jgi:hypothetical protein
LLFLDLSAALLAHLTFVEQQAKLPHCLVQLYLAAAAAAAAAKASNQLQALNLYQQKHLLVPQNQNQKNQMLHRLRSVLSAGAQQMLCHLCCYCSLRLELHCWPALLLLLLLPLLGCLQQHPAAVSQLCLSCVCCLLRMFRVWQLVCGCLAVHLVLGLSAPVHATDKVQM